MLRSTLTKRSRTKPGAWLWQLVGQLPPSPGIRQQDHQSARFNPADKVERWR